MLHFTSLKCACFPLGILFPPSLIIARRLVALSIATSSLPTFSLIAKETFGSETLVSRLIKARPILKTSS